MRFDWEVVSGKMVEGRGVNFVLIKIRMHYFKGSELLKEVGQASGPVRTAETAELVIVLV